MQLKNYINGKFLDPASQQHLDNINPATGKVYGQIPRSGKADVDLAVNAAKMAFPAWSATPKNKRAAILLKLADLIEENLDRLAKAESVDQGKPVWLATAVDIPRAASNFRFYATGIMHFDSKSHDMEGTAINYSLKQPIGIAGCISPWNLPLYLFSWKIAPALAAGNCVVAKPSEITPVTAFLLCELAQQAGLPDGVLNVVHGLGPEVGQAIVEHPEIPVLSFTGGTLTGSKLAATAAPMFKKISLELGGKNPNIIFDDCDFESMLDTTIKSSFSNQGEICLCGSRIFIQRGIYERFRDAFVARTRDLVVGDPADSNSNLGAIASHPHLEKILSYIKVAKEEGGQILCGGEQVQLFGELKNGYYMSPTVIEGLDHLARCNQEEIFGPVVTLCPFDTEEEVLRMANSTRYGLAAMVWTKDIDRAHRVAHQLHSGIVWVNTWLLRDLRTPFGGVKDSGVGREGGFEALEFFTEPKNVCIKINYDQ